MQRRLQRFFTAYFEMWCKTQWRSSPHLLTHFKTFQTLTNLFRFADDIEEMTGTRPNLFWMVCWKYISPAALIVILFSSFYNIIKDSPSYKLYVGCIQQEVSLDIYFFCSDIVAMIIISLNMALTIALVQINQSKKPTKILTETFLV